MTNKLNNDNIKDKVSDPDIFYGFIYFIHEMYLISSYMHSVNLNTVVESWVQYVTVSLQMLFCGHDQDSQRNSKSNQRRKLYRLPWAAWKGRLPKAINCIDSAKLCGWLIMKLEIHKIGLKNAPPSSETPSKTVSYQTESWCKKQTANRQWTATCQQQNFLISKHLGPALSLRVWLSNKHWISLIIMLTDLIKQEFTKFWTHLNVVGLAKKMLACFLFVLIPLRNSWLHLLCRE